MIIEQLDFDFLKQIPLWPEEKTRGQIVMELKAQYPTRYKKLDTTCADRVLAKWTKRFLLIEDKELCDSLFFLDRQEAECLQSVLEPIDLEWVRTRIGIDVAELDEDEDIVTLPRHKRRDGWYRQSKYRLGI